MVSPCNGAFLQALRGAFCVSRCEQLRIPVVVATIENWPRGTEVKQAASSCDRDWRFRHRDRVALWVVHKNGG